MRDIKLLLACMFIFSIHRPNSYSLMFYGIRLKGLSGLFSFFSSEEPSDYLLASKNYFEYLSLLGGKVSHGFLELGNTKM